MLEVFSAVSDFARQGQPIIMFGPSGAGKEFMARYYYAQYKKATGCTGDFISLNCSQLVKETAQSTLFGHLKGSFTDSSYDRKGVFEQADKGVLFLDEIGDLDKGLQTMVNRAMDENTRTASKLGSEKTYSTKDVLVICATERPKKRLNDSLLFRAGLQIHVPGLDDRPEDVEEAIRHFCMNAMKKRLDLTHLLSCLLKRGKDEIDDKSLNDPEIQSLIQDIARHLSPLVKARDWPGNFRALRTAVDSGVIRAKNFNSPGEFMDDVKKYFLHHLGDYSITVLDELKPAPPETAAGIPAAKGIWMDILTQRIPDLDNQELIRLDAFLSEYRSIPFKRKDFERYMILSTRIAQIRISSLIENGILEKVAGKGYRYQLSKELRPSDSQRFNPPHLMDLPEAADETLMPEKMKEALRVIENSRGLFVSSDDSLKRESFLGLLGTRLQETHDVIYFSFQGKGLEDFISACKEHLSKLNLRGWFMKKEEASLELQDRIIGLSGYFVQSLSQHRQTVIMLEGIDVFCTGESHALLEQMIYFWYPVQFVLGTTKQFFQQLFPDSTDFMELNL